MCLVSHGTIGDDVQKASKGNLLSWENSWDQDLSQYCCYGTVPNKRPAWILDHFWNLSNKYCSNSYPLGFSARSKRAVVIKAIAKATSACAEGNEDANEDVITLPMA